MHTVNRMRSAKGLLRIWRTQPDTIIMKVGRDFALKVRETMSLEKNRKKQTRII